MLKLTIKKMEKPDRIIHYWMKEKPVVGCIVFFGLVFNISMILGPIIQGKLIDSLAADKSLAYTVGLVLLFLFTIIFIQIFRYFKRFYIRRFANSTSATMRLMIYNNIMHKEITELKQDKTGDLMTKAVSDVELCVEGMRKFTTEIFDTGVLMLSYLVTMAVYDIKITLLSVLFIPLAMFLAEKLKGIIYKYTAAYRKKSSEVTGTTYEFIDNAMLYRVSGIDDSNLNRYNSLLEELQTKAVKANILENSMQPVYNVIAMAGVLIVIYYGGTKVIEGSWSLGTFSAYITIFIAMAAKSSKASKLFNSIQKSQISWLRIKPYLTAYRKKEVIPEAISEKTTLEVRNLSFCYQQNQENILESICFEAKQGEIIGVTGPIAGGKSSLGIALTGLYPYLGSILIDGRELGSYTEAERSGIIAYMGHKAELLSDTIYNNITLGSGQDITEVIKDVCFDADLSSMPKGWNTLVGNGGVRLSGGQQARLALARALLNKNKLIILDDPFSAVDMNTELAIINNLRAHYKNSIIFLISHRLAIFHSVDRILFLKGKNEVDYGTHKELTEKSELYATIYRLQMLEGGEKNEE